MNLLEREDKTYRLNELPQLKSKSFIWNGCEGYTGSIFRRTIKSSLHIYKHYGIFYGFDYSDTLLVLENNQYGIECVTYRDFMAGHDNRAFAVDHFVQNTNDIAGIINRAKERESLIYDERKNNCENFVNYCVYGINKSRQVEATEGFVDALIMIPELALLNEPDKKKFELFLRSVDRIRRDTGLPRSPKAQRQLDQKKQELGLLKKPVRKVPAVLKNPNAKLPHIAVRNPVL